MSKTAKELINDEIGSRNRFKVNASEILDKIYNDLSDEDIDALNDWEIVRVSELKEYLFEQLNEVDDIESYASDSIITALYSLLDYNPNDFVIYQGEVYKLEIDELMDALDIDD